MYTGSGVCAQRSRFLPHQLEKYSILGYFLQPPIRSIPTGVCNHREKYRSQASGSTHPGSLWKAVCIQGWQRVTEPKYEKKTNNVLILTPLLSLLDSRVAHWLFSRFVWNWSLLVPPNVKVPYISWMKIITTRPRNPALSSLLKKLFWHISPLSYHLHSSIIQSWLFLLASPHAHIHRQRSNSVIRFTRCHEDQTIAVLWAF